MLKTFILIILKIHDFINPKTIPINFFAGGIAPLVGEPSYAADFYDDRTPMSKGNRALTNVQNEFLKMQLANNPEYIAKYFPNVVTEGPRGPLYDVNYDRGKPGNVSYEDGAEFRDFNVSYDTKGSRLNIRATPEQEYIGGHSIMGSKRPGSGYPTRRLRYPNPDYTEYAYMKPDEQFYEGKEITGGQTQAINMAPWILESYGTKASSPRNEMVNSPEWWTKAGKDFGFETGPTVDQATLNDFIESVLAHETAHGVADKSLYKSDTKEATTLDFKKFLTPNQKQAHKYKNFKVMEYDQEEMFTRMKDIERLKKMYPDSYEKHPLWKLYQNRAEEQFKRITGQEEQDKVVKKGFNDYKKKIKPMVDEYFEKVEMKGRGIADINIEKAEIGMPEHLTREEPFEREYGSPFAQGGRIGMAGGSIVKGGKWFIKNLRQAYDELIEGKAFTHLPEWEREGLKWEILAQMKQIERGGNIPKDMIEHMRKDKRFKDITKTRSTDPELYEVEDVLLNYGKKGDVVDEQVKILEKI